MIASGYEWICPECDWMNCEIELLLKVRCRNCNTEFETDGAEHAYS